MNKYIYFFCLCLATLLMFVLMGCSLPMISKEWLRFISYATGYSIFAVSFPVGALLFTHYHSSPTIRTLAPIASSSLAIMYWSWLCLDFGKTNPIVSEIGFNVTTILILVLACFCSFLKRQK